MKKYIIKIIISIVSIIVFSCGSRSPESQPLEIFSAEFLKGVEVSTVTLQNVERQLRLTGKVDYDHDRVIRYISLVGGVVVNAPFHLGNRVQRGQTMAVIRSAELSEMEAERKSLETEIAILKRELESAQSMYNDNLLSQRELLEAQGLLRQAEVELEKTLINLSLFGSSGSNGVFVIKSPISGFVVEKNITAGTQIVAESEEPLFVVADISRVWVIGNVHVSDLAFVKTDMPVEIRTLAYPNEVFFGKINVLSQVFDSEERVLKARIVMPNDDLRLKPEMMVDITVRESCNTQMAVVPSVALIFDDNRHFVVKQVANSFINTEVKLHSQTNGISYVVSGLEADDKVVIKDNLLMYNKLKE